MFRLIRKVVVGGAIVAAGLMLLSWAGLSSYPATLVAKGKEYFKKQVSPEFEIERARLLLSQLQPDMRKQLNAIAVEIVAVKELQEDVENTRVTLGRQKDKILAMTKELDNGTATVSYAGELVDAKQLRRKLDADFTAFKNAEAKLKSKEKLLVAKEAQLKADKEQLEALKTVKIEIEDQIEQLEAELKTVRVAQTKSKIQFDASKLGQLKSAVAELRRRVNVEKTTLELEGKFLPSEITSEKPAKSSRQLTEEIKGYFGDAVPDSKVADKK
jgi:hypothetical protein